MSIACTQQITGLGLGLAASLLRVSEVAVLKVYSDYHTEVLVSDWYIYSHSFISTT